MILVLLSLVAQMMVANVVEDGNSRELSRAGVQTSGHLRALQSLVQIDTQSDRLEDEGVDAASVARLRRNQRVLLDSLDRMQAPGAVEWAREVARKAQPGVTKLMPAVDAFVVDLSDDGKVDVELEEHMDDLLASVQGRFTDVRADPSHDFQEAIATAAADDERAEQTTLILIPIGLLFVTLCAWQLRASTRRTEQQRERMESELRVSQRLDAAGQLAAGIAHEINTPVQFVGDGVRFLREAFVDMQGLITIYQGHTREDAAEAIAEAEETADLEYLQERVPGAFDRCLDGLGRVATIVGAMKEFGRPEQIKRAPADLNDALRSTLVVCQNEYKYVADVETDFADLPHVVCNVGELNQAFLNLIVNAAHAIADCDATDRGTIKIATARENGSAIVTFADDGPGIPADIRERIFDPFFTTKPVGRGTGQGLAITRSIIDKHGGTLTVESELGCGSTFALRVPIGDEAASR